MKRNIILFLFLLSMCTFASAQESATSISGQTDALANSVATPKISWKVPNYSLIARQMSLRDGFKTFGATQGISVIMSEEVSGVFSGEFRNMPADEFLDRVTTLHNLIWYYDGSILYIYGLSEVQSMLIGLKYMKADEVRTVLQELNIEDKRYPIRTASNDELILVYGPPRYVSLIIETIERADSLREKRTFNDVETRIFPLRHTWAEDVTMRVTGPESAVPIRGIATMLRELMTLSGDLRINEVTDAEGEKDGAKKDEDKKGDIEEFRPIIKAENRLNAVIVRDIVTRMPVYERLIKQLDKPQRLIEIAVTKVDLSRNDALDWQLSLGINGKHSDFSGSAGQNVANMAEELTGRGLAGMMTYIGSSFAVNTSLAALREKGKARNISRTSLLTINNMAAKLTDKQSYHARVVGTEVASLEKVSTGTSLEIKPRIVKSNSTSELDRVWLSLQLNDGGFKSVEVDSMPMTSESSVETQALVPMGESILLAGYTREIKEEGGWGIPFLRDIPWIGWIFGGKSWNKETVQRFFVLTPYILDIGEPDVVRTQATRLRNLSDPLELEYESDIDHAARREEDAKREEARIIYEEKTEDIFERNEGERKLNRQIRRDKREEEMDIWEKDLDNRRKAYREEKKMREREAKNRDKVTKNLEEVAEKLERESN